MKRKGKEFKKIIKKFKNLRRARTWEHTITDLTNFQRVSKRHQPIKVFLLWSLEGGGGGGFLSYNIQVFYKKLSFWVLFFFCFFWKDK